VAFILSGMLAWSFPEPFRPFHSLHFLRAVGLLGLVGFPFAAWSWTRLRLETEQARLSRSWPTVSGTIQNCAIEERRLFNLFPRYILRVEYRYDVGERSFLGDTFAFAPRLLVGGPELDRLVGEYKTQAPVAVHYNPADPAEAVLHTGAAFAEGRRLPMFVLLFLPFVLGVVATIVDAGR
jgi:hypothetical protein